MHNYHSGGAAHEMWAPDCRYPFISMKIFIWTVCVFNTQRYKVTRKDISNIIDPFNLKRTFCVIFPTLFIACFDKKRTSTASIKVKTLNKCNHSVF